MLSLVLLPFQVHQRLSVCRIRLLAAVLGRYVLAREASWIRPLDTLRTE